MKKVEEPSDEDVDVLQIRYIAALTELFETHKSKFGVTPETTLTIV